MNKRQRMWLLFAGLYLILGVAFDKTLHKKNAPTGVPYTPTIKFIVGWPYYLTKSNL